MSVSKDGKWRNIIDSDGGISNCLHEKAEQRRVKGDKHKHRQLKCHFQVGRRTKATIPSPMAIANKALDSLLILFLATVESEVDEMKTNPRIESAKTNRRRKCKGELLENKKEREKLFVFIAAGWKRCRGDTSFFFYPRCSCSFDNNLTTFRDKKRERIEGNSSEDGRRNCNYRKWKGDAV